jgi:pimeloyl-ACP methyl ester carboxylesterase
MPYADHNGVHIHYKVEGQGPPLVLQHGTTLSIERWYQTGYVESLKRHFQLILVDGRGHGASDKPHDRAAYALLLRVGDVVAVLDSLRIQKAHYLGYSMGGWIGFGMAKHAANRLLSLMIGGAHPYAEHIEAFRNIDGTDQEAFITAFQQLTGSQITPEMKTRMLANDLKALAASLHDRESIEDVLPTMKMPCFFFVGEADPRLSKVQKFVKQISNATFISLPNLDHAAAFMRSDLVLPHIMNFLKIVIDSTKTGD